jgi:hypothetical protein
LKDKRWIKEEIGMKNRRIERIFSIFGRKMEFLQHILRKLWNFGETEREDAALLMLEC